MNGGRGGGRWGQGSCVGTGKTVTRAGRMDTPSLHATFLESKNTECISVLINTVHLEGLHRHDATNKHVVSTYVHIIGEKWTVGVSYTGSFCSKI